MEGQTGNWKGGKAGSWTDTDVTATIGLEKHKMDEHIDGQGGRDQHTSMTPRYHSVQCRLTDKLTSRGRGMEGASIRNAFTGREAIIQNHLKRGKEKEFERLEFSLNEQRHE